MMDGTMNNSLNDAQTLKVAFAFGYFSLAYLIFFFSWHSTKLKDRFEELAIVKKNRIPFIYCIRILGFVLLGLLPVLIYSCTGGDLTEDMGLRVPAGDRVWLWWLIPLAVFFLGISLRTGKRINTGFYPQARYQTWSSGILLINGLSWAIYLIGYEIAFRGFLFFPLVNAIGLFPAIMINCSLYSISHIPKGAGEAFGAFFLGIIFCVITYQTGSILIPVVLHILLAVSNDWKAMRVNPEMSIPKRGSRL
ncbi:MAG TPA: hypothetical protein DCK95_03020 [Anaerolineaceae bacterium]|nr:hypothetical protein [Anaerolineaceae bacterium]